MGCNALRASHSLTKKKLALTDRVGIAVVDEIFDTRLFNKTDNNFHLTFPEWHEPHLRKLVRRGRNHRLIVL